MPNRKTAAFPYRWPNGSYHSRPYAGGHGVGMAGSFGPGKTGPKASQLAKIKPPGPIATPPFDPALEAQKAYTDTRRTTLLSDLNVDVTKTASDYGFQFNPATGAFGGFDPSNPFSQAALLLKSRKEAVSRDMNSFGRRVNSGAYQAQRAETQFQGDRAYNALRSSFDSYVTDYLRRKRDIQTVSPEELATL